MGTIRVGSTDMPSVGLGLWKIDSTEVPDLIADAIEIGYRHLDSAADYGNEEAVGEGIAAALNDGLCRREELWVTSKLWNTYHRPEHVRGTCEKILADLRLDYLDLFLIHFPISLKYVDFATRYPPEWIHDPDAADPAMLIDPVPLMDTWQAMEALLDAGLVREIGVCNYNAALLNDLQAYARHKPAMLQIESHPHLTQERLLRLAASYDMAVTAFSPLGSLSYVSLGMAAEADSLLDADVVRTAAERTGKSAAQVILRWGVQRGHGIIPKTSHRDRLKENLALFDFELTGEEMTAIAQLNKNRRYNDPGDFCEAA
ncbi:MAG: aldo/keto reductase, partial [Gammaproteobacteria bacterium]|nr:aldo/keto reductase [Gammaproteobacteria bacterium]